LTGSERPVEEAEFVFFAHAVADLADEERRFILTSDEITLLNPNTRTCPIFRSRRDAEITKAIYRRVPVLIREGPPEKNPWGISFMTMFHMTNDSGLFRTRDQLESEGWQLDRSIFHRGEEIYLPLYEDWMIHQYDHRTQSHGNYTPTIEELKDPDWLPLPRYWVPEMIVREKRPATWQRSWMFGFRNRTRTTDSRTVIFGVLPAVGVGNPLPLIFPEVPVSQAAGLLANLNSLVLDYVARQKVGGLNLNFFYLKQFPVLPPITYESFDLRVSAESLGNWIRPRVLELVYTSWNLKPFAEELGYRGPPFTWDDGRRFLLQCELDAAYFHLYGINRDDVDHIIDSFPIAKRKDEQEFDEYRTKRVILEIYDKMEEAYDQAVPHSTTGVS
jgi:hypothetical protein